MIRQGHIVEITAFPLGSPLAADVTTGATTLTVVDLADFNESGGSLSLSHPTTGVLETIAYTSGDDETGIIQLATATTGPTYPTDAFVAVSPAGIEKTAMVILDDQDDALSARVPHGLYDRLPEGIRDLNDQESVTVELDAGGEWSITDVLGKEPTIDGSYFDPTTLPDPVPILPPAVSPAVTLTGIPGAIIVRSDAVAPSTLIEYHVSATSGFTPGPTTQVGVDTRATVVVIDHLTDGSALVEDTDYFVRTIATNVAGSAAASAEVVGRMDMTAVAALVVAELVAGFILAGRITVGSAYWDASEGLVFPQPDGGVIRFPVDGVTAAEITAHLTARSLTVADNANFYGLSQLYGTFRLGNGISDPAVKATLSSTWNSLATDTAGTANAPFRHGLLWENVLGNDRWTTVEYYFGAVFKRYDPSTGAITNNTQLTTAEFNPLGGITRLSTDYYVLGRDSSRGDAWYVYKFNGSLVKQAEWALGTTPGNLPAIGNDGTNLIIAWCATAGTVVRLRTYTTAGVQTASMDVTNAEGSGTSFDMGGVFHGTADFGADRWVIAPVNKTLRAYNSAGTRVATHDWGRAASAKVNGLAWDGTRFQHLNDGGVIYRYATGHVSDSSVDGRYSWYDGDATGGTHETAGSPSSTYTWPARSRLVITGKPAPEAGITDPTKTDKANLVRLYAGPTAGTIRLQSTLAVGTVAASFESLDVASVAVLTVSTFTGAAVAPGVIESAAVDGSAVPLIQLKGDGSGRLMKLAQAGVVSTGAFSAVQVVNSVTVTFAVAFAATPSVVVIPSNVTNPDNAKAVVSGITTTQFIVQAMRPTGAGTTAFNVSWIAQAATQ